MNRQLSTFETANVLTNEHYPFNTVIALRLEQGPTAETLGDTLKVLGRDHKLLQQGVEKRNKRFFFIDRRREIPLTIARREDESHWLRLVEGEVNRRVDLYNEPPLTVFYLNDGEGRPGELILTFQHVVMDATSAAFFLDQLLTGCGTPHRLKPAAPEPLPAAETLFPQERRGFKGAVDNLSFMLRSMGDELKYMLRTRKLPKIKVPENDTGKILTREIPAHTTRRLLEISRRKRVTVNNLLNAAMLLTVDTELYEKGAGYLRHFNFADLRPYLVPAPQPEQLGCLFAMMRFTVPMTGQTDLLETAAAINDLTYKSFKRGDKFSAYRMSAVMVKTMLKSPTRRMGDTALSFTGMLGLKKEYGNIRIREVHAFVSNFRLGPRFTAQARVWDGRLFLDFLYLEGDMDHQQASRMADGMAALLTETATTGPETETEKVKDENKTNA